MKGLEFFVVLIDAVGDSTRQFHQVAKRSMPEVVRGEITKKRSTMLSHEAMLAVK